MPIRVLMISTCFPHPENMALGTWARVQAESLIESVAELRVVSPTSYVPKWLARLGKGQWAANSPRETNIGDIPVTFPKWPYYYVGPFREIVRRWPGLLFSIAWPFIKRALLKQIHLHPPDILFANHSFDGGETARRLSKLTGIPFLVAEHELGDISDCIHFSNRKRFYDRIYEEASAVIAVSERMRSEILSLFPSANVVIARLGRKPLNHELWEAERPQEIVNKTVLFSASGFFERKDIPALIQAFSQISVKHPKAVLRIAGDGPERAKIEEAIRIHDKLDQVQVIGRISHSQVLQEMVWADAFVLTGWNEPFATVYVEALAAGLPIVCCSDGGICDLAQNGIHGLIVPPRSRSDVAAALDRLLTDQAMRERMAKEARRLFDTKLTERFFSTILINEMQSALSRPTLS